MVKHLRANKGKFGMVTANGGFLSKHAAAIYSTTSYHTTHPAATEWRRTDPSVYQATLDAVPDVAVASRPSGDGQVEAYTVVHNTAGSTKAICVGKLLETGERFVAVCTDKKIMQQIMADDASVCKVKVTHCSETKQNIFELDSKSKL